VLVLDVGVQQDHPDLNLAPAPTSPRTTAMVVRATPATTTGRPSRLHRGCDRQRIGTVGIAHGCPVLSARIGVSLEDCSGTFMTNPSATVLALAWAFVRGARASNNSNGYGFTFNSIDDAYASTRDGGMVHFASAGNGGSSGVPYPASLPSVLAVGRSTRPGRWHRSATSARTWIFVAPGVMVYTTDRTGTSGWTGEDWVYGSGTSFSSPYAAGVAALIVSQNPGLTAPEIET